MKIITGFLQYLWQRFSLILKELRSTPFTTVIVLLVVMAGVLGGGILQVIGNNYNKYFKKSLQKFPPNTIVVTPKKDPISSKLMFIKTKVRRIPGTDLARMSKIPGVKKTHPFMELNIPLQAILPLPFSFGKNANYRTDLVGIGAPYSIIKQDLNKANRKKWLSWQPGQEVPSLLPRKLVVDVVELMLKANNLPMVNPNVFIGYKGSLLFGRSSFKALKNFEKQPLKLIGFSDQIEDTALILPLSVVRKYNEKFHGAQNASSYFKVIVDVTGHKSLLSVSRRIKKMGYKVDVGTGESRRLLQMQAAVKQFVTLITTIVLILAIIAIAFSSVIATLQRVDYFRIMRVLGASNIFLTLSIVAKAALIGYLGASLGLFLVNRLPGIAGSLVGNMGDFLSIPGFSINPYLSKDSSTTILRLGTLIPMLSTVPALIMLYIKGLNRD